MKPSFIGEWQRRVAASVTGTLTVSSNGTFDEKDSNGCEFSGTWQSEDGSGKAALWIKNFDKSCGFKDCGSATLTMRFSYKLSPDWDISVYGTKYSCE
jgi:hypothetical protein